MTTPANWGALVIDPRHGGQPAQPGAITCPRTNLQALIDSDLQAREWLLASTLAFDKPEPEIGPQSPVPVPGSRTDRSS